MKTSYYFKVRNFFVAAALGMGLIVASPAFAQALIGPDHLIGANGEVLRSFWGISCCGRISLAGINDAGQVAGTSPTEAIELHGASQAFRTGPNGMGASALAPWVVEIAAAVLRTLTMRAKWSDGASSGAVFRLLLLIPKARE
jgi:hypothetical protein